jgi:hypothetical protein
VIADLNQQIRSVFSPCFVEHPTAALVLNEVDWLVKRPRPDRAQGIIVSGPPKSGKTAIASAISSLHGERVLSIQGGGSRSVLGFYARMLAALDSPHRPSHRESDREALVVRLIKARDIRLLIIDEVQDIASGDDRNKPRVLEVIKLLMNTSRLAIVAFGTEGAASPFRTDDHLLARFRLVEMGAWVPSDCLASFLNALESRLGLPKKSNLADPDRMKLICEKADGQLGDIVEVVRNSAVWAIVSGSACINEEHIALSDRMPPNCPLPGETNA